MAYVEERRIHLLFRSILYTVFLLKSFKSINYIQVYTMELKYLIFSSTLIK
jgi:hypothetical protein